VDAIRRPVLVIQGGDDLMAEGARRMARRARSRLRGAHRRLHGHLTLVEHLVPDVHTWLLSHN
jgi:hypothetical protein